MTKYQCSICKRNFRQKCHLNDHSNKKSKCVPLIEVPQNNTNVPQNNTIVPQNNTIIPSNNRPINDNIYTLNGNLTTQHGNLEGNHQCRHCNKYFARKDAMNRHIKQYCPIAKQQNNDKQEIFDRLVLLESKNKQLEEEIKLKDKQLEVKDKLLEEEIKLKDENKTIQTITLNSNNTNSNNTTNNTININVVPHGEEDLSKYSNLLLVLAAKRGINAVLELTDRIHFNPQLPEFQNVYIPDIKNKHAMVFDKVWTLKNTDDIISNIYDTKSDFIKDNEDVFFNYLSVGEKLVYQRWVATDNDRNSKEYKIYIDGMHEKIKLLLYNKRDMVIATKKIQTNKKRLL
jgi:phage FluMu protein Com